MAQLTNEQVIFLKRQYIAPSQIFDASNTTSKIDREAQMKSLELLFYYGGAPCKTAGHTLRTRAGHCIQCDTSRIAYQMRHSASGFVYLAYSKSKQLAKVGFTKNSPQCRAEILRNEHYANASDWAIKQKFKFEKDAGKKEFAIHSLLEAYWTQLTYEKSRGCKVECREVFSCSQEVATKAFEDVVNA